MKLSRFLAVVLVSAFATSFVAAQDKSYQNFLNNKDQYTLSLREIIQETEKDLDIKIVCAKSVEPYLDQRVVMAPWKFWDDPVRRLAYILAPLDLSFEQVDEKTWRVFEPWYYIRPEEEGKAHLARLLRRFPTKDAWEARKNTLQNTILEKLHLAPIPKPVLTPYLSEKRAHDGYSVRNIALEILPGYFVNGNLYEPTKEGKFPLILCPHGHGQLGRFGADQQIRAAVLARMGAVVFSYSMFAWRVEESPLPKEAHADPISGTMQTLHTIRSIDWLTTLPNVDATRIGITGASGGGTQTFLGTALDSRISVSVPVVMVSSHFYGGCPCESGVPFHILHGGTCNAEVAAMAAPRPMKIIAVAQDWTKNVPEVEFPYIQKIYEYYGAKENVEYAFFDEPHNYGESKRQAMYPFMAKHLNLNVEECDETKATVEPMETMLYFGPNRENYPAHGIQSLEELKKVFFGTK
ncbi:MAG: acetylxylan esterase [Planctomycetia bacterium]|nr:acetylxylan esterase [Planctomycetia bacterium]